MRFVSKWSYACAKKLANATNEDHNKRSAYYFGFQILLGALVKGVILISVSLLLGILIPTLLISLVFASMRMFAGGYHMDTYGKCLFVSMCLFVAAGCLAQYTSNNWGLVYIITLIAITFVSGLYAVVRYAPKDTPNKPITKPEEIRKFKRLSIIYLFIWLVVVVLLAVFGSKLAVLSFSFAVLIESFTITPSGHKFFEFVRKGMDNKLAYK